MWDFVSDITLIRLSATLFAFLATIFSAVLVYKHLFNYTQPNLQRYIVRILLMVPIYAIDSWISLLFIDISIYIDVLRDAYEAYVVYTFFTLLIAYVNSSDLVPVPTSPKKDDPIELELGYPTDESNIGESVVPISEEVTSSESKIVEILERKPISGHPFPTCCFPKFKPGKKFLYTCKRSVYQFVVIKPLMAVLTIFLEYYGLYDDGSVSLTSGYLYIMIVDNISVTLAMYMLVLFYHVTKDELRPFKPVPKFLCIKAVILFAFWQGIIIAVLVWFGVIFSGSTDWDSRAVSAGLQDFLICVEMFFISIAHSYTFSYKPYRSPELTCSDFIPCYSVFCCCCCCCSVTKNFTHVVSQRDVLADGVDTFAIDQVPSTISSLGKEAKNLVGSKVSALLTQRRDSTSEEFDNDILSDHETHV